MLLTKLLTKNMNKMKKNERLAFFFIILILMLSFFLTFCISLKFGKPIGSDFWFHLDVAESYAKGENALFSQQFMSAARGPYPPLFHIILAFFVLMGAAVQFASILQIFFYPLAIFTSAFLVWKKVSPVSAAFLSILLFSSVAFFDRSAQVIPQAFDMILFPLTIYFFLEKRMLSFLSAASFMIYSHGAFGLLLIASLCLYGLKFRINAKMIRNILVICAPIILLFILFLPSHVGLSGEIKSNQEKMAREDMMFPIKYTGWLPICLFIFSFSYLLITNVKMAKLDFLLIFWVICLGPLLIFYPDRFWTYVVVPTCIISSKTVSRIIGDDFKVIMILLFVLFAISLMTYIEWWQVLLGQGNLNFDIS